MLDFIPNINGYSTNMSVPVIAIQWKNSDIQFKIIDRAVKMSLIYWEDI